MQPKKWDFRKRNNTISDAFLQCQPDIGDVIAGGTRLFSVFVSIFTFLIQRQYQDSYCVEICKLGIFKT